MASLSFRAQVPVFDANVGVGHRHDRISPCEDVAGLLQEMERHGVERALIHHVQGESISPLDGNEELLAWEHPALELQWTLGPTPDSLRQLQELHAAGKLKSVRLHYSPYVPFVEWIYGEALAWLGAERIPLWVPLADMPAVEVMATLRQFPDVATVLLGAHYTHALVVRPLLNYLPKAHLELSRYEMPGEVEVLAREFGAQRLLYGSFYPRYAMGPMLYYVHHCQFSEAELWGICAGNVERLLKR